MVAYSGIAVCSMHVCIIKTLKPYGSYGFIKRRHLELDLDDDVDRSFSVLTVSPVSTPHARALPRHAPQTGPESET